MRIDRRRLIAAAAATAPLLGLRPADAAAPFANAPAPAWYRFRLGGFECTVVSDGPLDIRPATMAFVDPDMPRLNGMLRAAHLPTESLPLPQNILVVNTGRQLVLFDTGMGDRSQAFGPATGRMMANLRAAGIDPATIDVVALTHPHIDHAWGLVDRNDRLNFPNARLAVTQADWDFWTDEALLTSPARDFVLHTRTNMLPYRERLLVVRDGAEMVPGIGAIATPGHTVGHVSYVIESDSQRLINMGDVCHHHIVLMRHPDWRVAFDSDPVQGARTRRNFMSRAASSGDLVCGFHFPFPGHGRVARDGEGFLWLPAPLHAG